MTPSASSSSKPRGKRAARMRWIAGIGLIVLLGSVTWLIIATSAPPPAPPQPSSHAASSTAGPGADSRRLRAVLFFVAEDGRQLVEVGREVAYGAAPVEQARIILEAQLQRPAGGLLSAIPAGTTLRNIFLTDRGEAYADFSHELATGHTGGSLDEALTVFTIVDAVTVNLPNITGVQILIDGKAVDSLAGHLDLRRPLERSLKWVRKGQ